MVTFTTAKVLTKPANSSYVGTWDQPTNANWDVVDAALGQVSIINLNNSPVTLSAAQFQCAFIIFRSTLTGNVPITFPTTFIGPYTILNECTGSSAFVVTLQTTVAGAYQIGCKPGDAFDCFNTGGSFYFRNMGHPGSYWDYSGSSAPAWISACTIPPYLVCDGTTFSSAQYPALATILNGTTLPDARGRARFSQDATGTRITSSGSGIAGNTIFATGGSEYTQTHNHTVTLTDPGHDHDIKVVQSTFQTGGSADAANSGGGATMTSCSETTGITVSNVSLYGSGTAQNMPPTYIGGITMIRAA